MAEQGVRIGLIQMSVSGDGERNLSCALELARQAASEGAGIICLQELFRTPYFPRHEQGDATPFAESIPGESTSEFAKFSARYGVSVIVPIFEKGDDGRYYNSAVVTDPSGTIHPPYRKVHIPHDPLFYEQNYFTGGEEYRVFTSKGVNFGVLICYDQWFPEAARAVTLLGADLIFYPTAIGWPEGLGNNPVEGDWRDAWETVQRGHAIANGVHVAAVNRWGIEGEITFWGSSFVSDAFGNVIARAASSRDAVMVVELDLGMNRLVREGWGFLRNRKPHTYQILTRGEGEGA